ncbi:MAG: hypothetical protein ACFFD4_07610 [Candidatus Odinarchaeota archaeon]
MFKDIKPAHEDHRRKLTAIFNGEFTAKQVKIIEVKGQSILGGHFHDYRELFYILKGGATFYLENVETKEKSCVIMVEGSLMILPPKVAHRVIMKEGTISIEATEGIYVDAETNDHPWKMECWFEC